METIVMEVPNHKGYYAENIGGIYSDRGKDIRKLKQFFHTNYVAVKMDGKVRSVGRIIAETFIPNSDPNRTMVFHMDSDLANNSVMNLEWVTPSEMRKLTKIPVEDRKIYLYGMRGELEDDGVPFYGEETDTGEING